MASEEQDLGMDYKEAQYENNREVSFTPGAPPRIGALPHLKQLRCLTFEDMEGGGGGGADELVDVPDFGDGVGGGGKPGDVGPDPIDRQPAFETKVWMARVVFISQLADVLNILGFLMLPLSFLIAIAHCIARSVVAGLYVKTFLELNKLGALPAVVYNEPESGAVKKAKIFVVIGMSLNTVGIAISLVQVLGPPLLLDLWALPYLAWIVSIMIPVIFFLYVGSVLSVVALNPYLLLLTLVFVMLLVYVTALMVILWFICGSMLAVWTVVNPFWFALIGIAVLLGTVICIYNVVIHVYTIVVYKMISDLPYNTTTVFDESYLLRGSKNAAVPLPPDNGGNAENLKGETSVQMPKPKVID